jgi:hypothetical protein
MFHNKALLNTDVQSFLLNFMNISVSKQFFIISISTSALFAVFADSVAAFSFVTLDYSGRFGNDLSCSIDGPPSNRRCMFEDLKGGSFSGFLVFDETGTQPRNTSIRLNLFDKDGLQVEEQIFINGRVDFNNNIANLNLQNLFGRFSEELTVKFQAPGVTSVKQPFGAFINGNYRENQGTIFGMSQSINIVDASVKLRQVPEGSLILGVFSCFSLSWLLKGHKN